MAALAVSAMTLAACGGGGSSIIDSGSTAAPGGDSAPETTVATPLADLPPCDTTALETATGPVNLTFW
ncbi:MAG: hypothetical protein ACKOA6_11505, partial [Actinomycetota bacterium]